MYELEKLFEYKEYEKEEIQYLIFFSEGNGDESIHEFLTHSDFLYAINNFALLSSERVLKIVTDPDIYKKHYGQFNKFKEFLTQKIYEFFGDRISSIRIIPNIKNFQISDNRYVAVSTPWDDINSSQIIMLEQFRVASNSLDYQNIGNSCRTIILKISNIVFDPQRHTDTDGKSVSEGDFKNRLHTYIKTELGGVDNNKIRSFSMALIDSAEKAVNLANDVTHSLNADAFIAESCVVSTISVINIIRIIEKNRNAI